MRSVNTHVNERFGMLTMTGEYIRRKNKIELSCKCDCGIEKYVRSDSVLEGKIISCGCYNVTNRLKNLVDNTTHGMSSCGDGHKYTPEYGCWISMVSRVRRHPDYKHLSVCPTWLGKTGFETFFYDMGLRPANMSLDRIDNALGYSNGNCRWADTTTQQVNKRMQHNTATGYFGVKKRRDKDRPQQKYQVSFSHAGKRYYCGCFTDAIEAANKYDSEFYKVAGDKFPNKFNFKITGEQNAKIL